MSYHRKDLSDQVCHHGVPQFYMWRKRMEPWGCVSVIGSQTRLPSRTTTHCPE